MKGSLIIYDSGIGGLSILTKLLKLKPDFDINYIADNAIFPMGDKNPDEITARLKNIIANCFDKGADLFLLGCNTATVNSIRELQQNWLSINYKNKKILGVSTPLIEILEQKKEDLKNKKGVILSTKATTKSNFYQTELLQIGYKKIEIIPCIGLADVIENGDEVEIEKYLMQLKTDFDLMEIDFLVLGCTHYPFAKEIIKKVFVNTKIIDPTDYIPSLLLKYIEKHKQLHFKLQDKPRINIYYTLENAEIKQKILKYTQNIDANIKLF